MSSEETSELITSNSFKLFHSVLLAPLIHFEKKKLNSYYHYFTLTSKTWTYVRMDCRDRMHDIVIDFN